MRDPQEFYIANIGASAAKLDDIKSRLRAISNIRLLIALIFAASMYGALSFTLSLLWFSGLLVIAFFYFVKRSAELSRDQEIAEKILQLNKNELDFIRGNKNVFDTGLDLVPKEHLYALDLDIFGTGSLFQSVNRTVIFEGRALLAQDLLYPLSVKETILERAHAVSELKEEVEWRQRFYATGALSGETREDSYEMRAWITQSSFYSEKKLWLWIAGTITTLSSLILLYIIATFDSAMFPQYFMVAVGLIGFNSTIMLAHNKDQKKYFDQFGRRTKLYEKFSVLFKMVAHHEFKSKLGKNINDDTREASVAFSKLSRLSNLADQRLNGLMGPFLNGLFCFDVWTIRRIENWRLSYGRQSLEWLRALARMDMVSSLANFSFNHPTFCDASIVEGERAIKTQAMGHPLLASSVKNDYQVGVTSSAHIITGSNMAGKSTFIRATGLNVILALNGMPVCAKSFSSPVMGIATCIRITDSLEDDTSYFKAELIRLKHIVDRLTQPGECLVLLDEILRGTNSDDKRNGTMSFYRKLRNFNCLALLATHDLAVGHLATEDPMYFENFCFESSVQNGELHFDYKLRKGVSSSTNATFLMKGLGLID